MVSPLSIIFS